MTPADFIILTVLIGLLLITHIFFLGYGLEKLDTIRRDIAELKDLIEKGKK